MLPCREPPSPLHDVHRHRLLTVLFPIGTAAARGLSLYGLGDHFSIFKLGIRPSAARVLPLETNSRLGVEFLLIGTFQTFDLWIQSVRRIPGY